MIFIFHPLQRVGGDVLADVAEAVFFTNDVFVIVALPEGNMRRLTNEVGARRRLHPCTLIARLYVFVNPIDDILSARARREDLPHALLLE